MGWFSPPKRPIFKSSLNNYGLGWRLTVYSNTKNLDLSYNMELDFWDCPGGNGSEGVSELGLNIPPITRSYRDGTSV